MVIRNELNHLAVIMDGNSRWAQQNMLDRYLGHKTGAEKAKLLIELAYNNKIKHLSLFAFSSENWQRSSPEIDYLLNLLASYLDTQSQKLLDKGIKLLVIGDLNNLSNELKNKIIAINDSSPKEIHMNLYIAFSYGGREELVQAVKKALSMKMLADEVSEANFANLLYAPQMPNIDLLIRTGGNNRISNFLLWHSAYSEIYFIKKYWPDFSEEDLMMAIDQYKMSNRTFGARNE